MSLKTIYPSFPPIARGNPSVIKTDAKRERIIYANSRTVVIKNVADPTKVQLFTGHQYPVTAVAMSPSGAYMATGDKSGKLMIWVRALCGPAQLCRVHREGGPARENPAQPHARARRSAYPPAHRRATPRSKSSRATILCSEARSSTSTGRLTTRGSSSWARASRLPRCATARPRDPRPSRRTPDGLGCDGAAPC